MLSQELNTQIGTIFGPSSTIFLPLPSKQTNKKQERKPTPKPNKTQSKNTKKNQYRTTTKNQPTPLPPNKQQQKKQTANKYQTQNYQNHLLAAMLTGLENRNFFSWTWSDSHLFVFLVSPEVHFSTELGRVFYLNPFITFQDVLFKIYC